MPVFDALIVGGGPAGSWTAWTLARAGARVALVDGSHPREKPCGGGVTGRALELIGDAVSPAALNAVPIEGALFSYRGGSSRVRLTENDSRFPPLVVAGRREFDGALLSAAVRAGAVHTPLRVVRIVRSHGVWTADTPRGSLSAAWIIGADGANSFVRRRVAQSFPRRDLSIASGYFVHGRSSPEIVVSFEHDPAGYLWSFPRADHLAVGVCAQADRSSSTALSGLAMRWVERQSWGGTSLERYSWPIPSLTSTALERERPAGPGWMLVGDAAGLVDPITREGIYFALRSAELAAESLIAGTSAAARYVERVREEIFSELARAARIKARFYQPRFIALLIAGLARSARIQRVMADLVAGRQTYRGLRWALLKTAEWRLMLSLFGER
jgi:geranylgeranyl reductase family protein